jgi:hypothetical protein
MITVPKVFYRPSKLWKLRRPSTPDSEETLQPSPISEQQPTDVESISSHTTAQNDSDDIKALLPKAAPIEYQVPSEQVLEMIKNCLLNEPIKNPGSVLKTAHLSNLTEELLGLAAHPIPEQKIFRWSEPLVTFGGPSSWDYYLMVQLEKIRKEAELEQVATLTSDQEDWSKRNSLDSVDSQELMRIPDAVPKRKRRSLNIMIQKLQESNEQDSAVTVDSVDDLWDSNVAASLDFSADMDQEQLVRSKRTLRRKSNFEVENETSFESLNQVIPMEQQIMEWKKQIQPCQPLKPILKRKSKFVKESDEIHFLPSPLEDSFVDMSDSDSISESIITATSFQADSISVESGSSIMIHGDQNETDVGLSVVSPVTVPLVQEPMVDKQLPMTPTSPKELVFDANYIKNLYQPIYKQKEPFRKSLDAYLGTRPVVALPQRQSMDSKPLTPRLFFKDTKALDCQKCHQPRFAVEEKALPSPKENVKISDHVRLGVKPKRSKVKSLFQKFKNFF